ncbi:MAG: HipA domain-containing protein [Bacteroidota bacterium]
MNKCLYCYQPLLQTEHDFHVKCAKKIFNQALPPEISFDETDLGKLAKTYIQSQGAITGVQPKLSLDIVNERDKNQPARFTIVGLWGNYILKPPTNQYKQLPEVEDLTMHLAEIAKIKTVPHTLIKLKSGNLAYITKRIDRNGKGKKFHMEDFCQLTEKQTEDKYRGSYEQIAKTITKYSANPGLDLVNFWEVIIFSFITGNADMHLKNFSIINSPKTGYSLTPAYDLVATTLVNPADNEELALNLNGKKSKLKKIDFEAAFNNSKLEAKQQSNIFNKFKKAKKEWIELIEKSFLDEDFKEKYKKLISERLTRLS